MSMRKFCGTALLLTGAILIFGGLSSANLQATTISMKLSGPGVVNDSTVKAGQKVSLDIYSENDEEWAGITFTFKMSSPTIKKVEFPSDSSGINERGNAHGFNGWQDKSIWDLFVKVPEYEVNGELPEVFGVGAAVVKNKYKPHPKQKILSFDVRFTETGTITVDSTTFAENGGMKGAWKVARSPRITPVRKESQEPVKWTGPVRFKVVK